MLKDIDEVLGGSGEVEKYATKSKKLLDLQKGAEKFEDNEMRALMEIDRLKDEGIIEWLKKLTTTIPPLRGPNPQGLNIRYNTVTTIRSEKKLNGRNRQVATKRSR